MTDRRLLPMWIAVAVLLAGGGAALTYAARIASWSRAEGSGESVHLMPEGHAWVPADIVPLLTVFGGGAILFAVALLLTGWLLSTAVTTARAGQPQPFAPATITVRPRRRLSFARLGPLALLVVLVIVVVRRFVWA